MRQTIQQCKPINIQSIQNPSVSLLVRVKNEMPALPEFWSRVCSQTIFSSAEILFLDSGSTDGTLEFLRSLPVSLYQIAPEDFCFGRSCNQLMALSRAPVTMFLSAHVLLERADTLEAILHLLSTHTHGAAYLRQVPNRLWGANFYEKAYLARRFPPRKEPVLELKTPGAFSNAGSALNRASWERNPFPEIHGSEDYLWAQRHLELGGSLFYCPGLTSMHSHNESPEELFQRVKLNVRSRKIRGSYFVATYYFIGVIVKMLCVGAPISETWRYAAAHARAYAPRSK